MPSPNKGLTYKSAGVDIDTADQFIDRIKPHVQKTMRPEVISSLGHYAGLFRLDLSKYQSPILVSSTDGVGTKVKLAVEWGYIDGLGQDLVGMSANDILCLGAEPLFFLDYFATGHLDPVQGTKIVKGIAGACAEIGAALIGGETAEMPSIYRKDDFDLAGFIVGVVDQDKIIDGSEVQPGDKMIGLASSGVHSNGFSLIRKIVSKKKLAPEKRYPGLETTLAKSLLAPTHLYGPTVSRLRNKFELRGIAHITGGGLVENLPRIFPNTCRAVIQKESWPTPPLFQWIQRWGHIAEEEMYRVFNNGIGLVLIVPSDQVVPILSELESSGEAAWLIGDIVARKKEEDAVVLL